jgi:sulfide:quinone oxidoreductase
MTDSRISPRHVVIVGGGVGALEALMALHDLGEHRLELTLVAPDDDFVLRPMSVAVPFSVGHVTRVPLAGVCARFGARRVQSAVAAVDPAAHELRCADGTRIAYDVLVLATGAAARPAYREALTFSDDDPMLLSGLLRDIEQGYCPSLALVVPPSGSWTLPIYELALLIARHAHSAGVELDLHLVTPEPAPLAIFGRPASEAIAELLSAAGVTVHPDSYGSVGRGGRITLMPGDRTLTVRRVVALPIVDGRPLDGIPTDGHGFVAVDEHARALGLDDVYAVGDGADFPVKQGGLAAQQADAAARQIAADAGAAVEPEPFRPVLRGMLLTGAGREYLRGAPAGGAGEGQASTEALWWPPAKVVGHYLAPWLAAETGVTAGTPPPSAGAVEVAAHLPLDRDMRPLALEPLGPAPAQGRW